MSVYYNIPLSEPTSGRRKGAITFSFHPEGLCLPSEETHSFKRLQRSICNLLHLYPHYRDNGVYFYTLFNFFITVLTWMTFSSKSSEDIRIEILNLINKVLANRIVNFGEENEDFHKIFYAFNAVYSTSKKKYPDEMKSVIQMLEELHDDVVRSPEMWFIPLSKMLTILFVLESFFRSMMKIEMGERCDDMAPMLGNQLVILLYRMVHSEPKNSSVNRTKLPNEIWLKISNHLDYKSKSSFSKTSRFFNDLIRPNLHRIVPLRSFRKRLETLLLNKYDDNLKRTFNSCKVILLESRDLFNSIAPLVFILKTCVNLRKVHVNMIDEKYFELLNEYCPYLQHDITNLKIKCTLQNPDMYKDIQRVCPNLRTIEFDEPFLLTKKLFRPEIKVRNVCIESGKEVADTYYDGLQVTMNRQVVKGDYRNLVVDGGPRLVVFDLSVVPDSVERLYLTFAEVVNTSNKVLPNIRELNLSTFEFPNGLFKNLPNLVKLSVQECVTTRKTLPPNAKFFPHLKILEYRKEDSLHLADLLSFIMKINLDELHLILGLGEDWKAVKVLAKHPTLTKISFVPTFLYTENPRNKTTNMIQSWTSLFKASISINYIITH
jgi:hypothetical protein